MRLVIAMIGLSSDDAAHDCNLVPHPHLQRKEFANVNAGNVGRNGSKFATVFNGASGLRSYVSVCGGPPKRQIMITDLGRDVTASAALGAMAQHVGKRQAGTKAPILRKPRRVRPPF